LTHEAISLYKREENQGGAVRRLRPQGFEPCRTLAAAPNF
jgi:hypothetical protein